MNTQPINVIDFYTLKQTIRNIISKADISITPKNSLQSSGIYLLYVNDFSDNKIIPFYIGQTTNFQRRFQNHLKDIKSLMQYSYSEYHNIFVQSSIRNRSPFDGHFRPCKIFKYLTDHHCTLDDIKMIVLEECEQEYLSEREEYYLSLYLPAYFGFNQIATITHQFTYRNNPAIMRSIVAHDYQCFKLYMEYGYSTFNYLHAFSTYHSEELDNIANRLLANLQWPTSTEHFSNVISMLENYEDVYKNTLSIIHERFSSQIHEIFEECHLKSKRRENEVLKAFTNSYATPVVDIVSENLEYLKYYFSRDPKSRKCGKLILSLYEAHLEDIEQINAPVKEAFEAYLEARNQAIEKSKYSIIFPLELF